MEKKVLVALAIGIVLIMGIVIVQGTVFAGLGRDAVREYESEAKELDSTAARLEGEASSVRSYIAKQPAVAKLAASEGWESELERARKTIGTLRERYAREAQSMVEANQKEDRPKLLALVSEVRSQRDGAEAIVQRLQQRAQSIDYFVTNKAEFLDKAAAKKEALGGVDLSTVESKCQQARIDCPDKDEPIGLLYDNLVAQRAEANRLYDEVIVVDGAKEVTDLENPTALFNSIERFVDLADGLASNIRSVSAQIDQLYVSVDKILIDMEIREGAEVELYHHYRVITIDKDDKSTEAKEWKKVDKATFERHKQHLGMSIYSKPKCAFEHEAKSVPAPPGYHYVGNSRYGRWDQRGGQRVWVWLATGYIMRDLFWGPSYYPVHRSSWDGYQRSYRSGRAFYGGTQSKPQYGSKGTFTQSRYKSSKYVKSGGYKNTKYVKSGGQYRGSRFASKSRSRSTSGRSYSRGGRSFGGSRSFGK